MDTTDNNTPGFEGKHDFRRLPLVRDMAIRVVSFKAPALKHFKSSLSDYDKALEILVTVDAPIPAIASSPALHIGKSAPIVLYEQATGKQNVYRFLAFKWDDLKQNETIYWGWNNDPPEKWVKTKFKYKLPG